MAGLTPFLFLVIALVTIAQTAGKSKRDKEKQEKELKNRRAVLDNLKSSKSKFSQDNVSRTTANQDVSFGGKIEAELEHPSFEVGKEKTSDIQGFDVK